MKNNVKNGAFIKAIGKCFLMFAILTGTVLVNTACEKDLEIPKENQLQNQNPSGQTPKDTIVSNDTTETQGNTLDPDIISEHLVFSGNALKITGSLPKAPDGQLKIDVHDTIYLVKGYPYGDRIQILAESGQTAKAGEVSGAFVSVVGSQIYHDVTAGTNAMSTFWIDETGGHHSTYTFNLDINNLPGSEDLDYPLSTDVIIQPHDAAGVPLDEFERTITIEDPENSCNDIRFATFGIPWEWEFSIRLDSNADWEELSAPGLVLDLGDFAQGCCGGITGETTLWLFDPGCHDQADTYLEMEIDPFYTPLFEILRLFDDGSAKIYARDVENNLDLLNTNLCARQAAYLYDDEVDWGEGTHDFTPGATTLELNFSNFNSFAKPRKYNDIIYTCHSLLIFTSFGEGGEIGKVYKLYDNNTAFDFEKLWFD